MGIRHLTSCSYNWGKRSNEKKANQGKQVRPGTTTQWILANCRPSCIRTFWPLGEKASEYLRVLSALWRDDNGRSNIAEFKTHWRQRFSIKLQQCNASVISRKMAVISAGQKFYSVLDEYQFVLN